MRLFPRILLACVLLAGCGDDDMVPGTDSGAADTSPAADAARRDAASPPLDGGTPPDASRPDASLPDAGGGDAAPLDAAASDGAGPDSALDASPEDGGTVEDAGDPGSPTGRGAALYARYCALCHGAAGEGYAADHAPAVGNADFLRVASDDFLRAAITEGRPGTPMSAWGAAAAGPLSDDDVGDLVAFLRSLATETFLDVSGVVVAGDAVRGATLYAADCAVCHGASGEGATALSLDHPNFQATASDGFLRWTVENGRRDTPMLGFGTEHDAADLDALVAHLRTLRRPDVAPPWPTETAPDLAHLVLNPAGVPPDFELRDGRYVPAIVVKAALDAGRRLIVLDARATSDWMAGHIPGAAPFPFYDVDMLADTLPNDGTWIVAYCACPHAASGAVVDMLRARGFANTAVLDEGIFFWRDHGYPMALGTLPP